MLIEYIAVKAASTTMGSYSLQTFSSFESALHGKLTNLHKHEVLHTRVNERYIIIILLYIALTCLVY